MARTPRQHPVVSSFRPTRFTRRGTFFSSVSTLSFLHPHRTTGRDMLTVANGVWRVKNESRIDLDFLADPESAAGSVADLEGPL